MRILVVGQDFPWPYTYGSHLRLAQVIEAAASIGEVDLFSFKDGVRKVPCEVPEHLDLRRVELVDALRPDYGPVRRLEWLVTRGIPHEVLAARNRTARRRFTGWADKSYDVVWFSKAPVFELLGRPRLGPTIVDLDDLEDQKITARLKTMRTQARGVAALHGLGAVGQARLNAARWRTLQLSVAKEVDKVALCSSLDIARLGAPNGALVPNGYQAPEHPAGKLDVGVPPTILLQGSLNYGPNTDAARWLVDHIAPLVRRSLPDLQIRLVGEPDGSVSGLDDPPRVTVVGRVPDMEPELARADLIAVPIRYASGTRVKILEAFAHHIPVVSTTLGAEGLDAQGDVHLLLADDAPAFAAACVRAMQDRELRARLAKAAGELFMQRYQWSTCRDLISGLMLSAAASKPA
jgi:polysaccharide biosynthesis protein PslH